MISDIIVFCDFDGTITAVETFAGMLKEFSPELSAQLMPKMYSRELTLKQGVRELLESIPSSRYEEIIEYVQSKELRPGLEEFLDYLAGLTVPFVVVSGGLAIMVEAALQRRGVSGTPLREKVTDVWAVGVDNSGEYLQVYSPVENDTEILAKVQVMEKYSYNLSVAIGDSVTDINMALKADIVFARDRLPEYLQTHQKAYIPWENFYDIREHLSQIWNS